MGKVFVRARLPACNRIHCGWPLHSGSSIWSNMRAFIKLVFVLHGALSLHQVF